MYYLNIFYLFSIFGFIFESTFVKLWNSNFNSGVLFGPWTPVYGIGVIVIILIHKWIDKHIDNNILNGVLLFFLCAIILSLLEFLGGVLIEIIFNKVYWSYEEMKYNLGHYISLEVASIWGIMSIILIYLINPIVEKFIEYVPKWLTIVLSVLFFIDFVITLIIK